MESCSDKYNNEIHLLHLTAAKFMDLKGTQLLLLLFAFLCSQVRKLNGDSIPGCMLIERNALLGFKAGLKDPTNRLSSWVGDDCCTWEGVACDNPTGHVVKLDLQNPDQDFSLSIDDLPQHNKWSLGGELRPSLLGLKHLNYLDLSMNNFGGLRIPEFLGSFRQLKYLDLSYAGLGGLIPPQLGNLSSLQYLYLQSDIDIMPPVTELSIDNALWISHLSSLRYLNMTGVKFREGAHWLQALNMLPSIVEVHLLFCDIKDIPASLPHVNFSSLSVLDLSMNYINSMMPAWLFNISSLEQLDLSNNFIQVIIPPTIKNLASLNFLDLSGNQFLEGKIPGALGGLCKLQHLRLRGINISKKLHEFDEGFNGCIKNSLETLEMTDTQFSGYLPGWLGDFRMLKVLDLSDNSISGPIPTSIGRLSALQELHLSNNKLNGTIPGSLASLAELVSLDLSINELNGTIPGSLGSLKELVFLDLSINELNGTIPGSLGSLKELVFLDIRSNFLVGVVSEDHFANFTKLNYLDLSDNQLILNLTSHWIPPFQLQILNLRSCKLGPQFPSWLQMQKNITDLDISSNGISDSVPDWFWGSFSRNITSLDISSNGITGPLPNFYSSAMLSLDLSNNSFSGVIHPGIGKSIPNLQHLSLSTNNLSGKIPLSLCRPEFWVFDLSKNHLLGELPDCWNQSSGITVMDFSSNNLSGSIPPSICSLQGFESLHLSNNNLSGELPLSLKSCVSLGTLDLGHNGFIGTIPTWIGESLLFLSILRLRSNKLVGNIPPNLSRLSVLQILDLANNNLSGTIPSSFENFTTMKVLQGTYGDISDYLYYNENLQVTMKGRDNEFSRFLFLVIAMDLSGNNLSGKIPEELANLLGLVSLNLSGNHLTGEITEKIGALRQLQSLDLSRNNLYGGIPSSMIALSFLSYLNLSYNNLSGRIPLGNQLQTFTDPSIYAGNSGLCGFPLAQKCKDDKTNQGPNAVGGDEQNDNAMDEEGSEIEWLYMSMGLGFAVGLWAVFGPLLFNRKWREAYFRLIDQVYDMVYVALAVSFNRLKEHNAVARLFMIWST
ncbi:receptor-like protein EIX2 [Phoenix dactylifera]|uniref:Receptor-like protein EIX2 n=1 Tax=Phoenix dactylifera TaxID=42345 RepID=A0A8B8ZWW1_PHODC|nr:receptor-like protein EIX2 [Phoenix dactylifera]